MCPACAQYCSHSTGVSFLQGLRGEKVWWLCSACKSFFDPQCYEGRREVLHTQKTAWGRMDSGPKLNTFKLKLYHSVLTLLDRHCPPPGKLVDIGCGYGGFLVEARIKGYDVFGVDIVPEAIEYVRSLSIPTEQAFSIGDVKSIEDGSLDVLTCVDCSCYWPDQPQQLRYAFAKLKPGGYLAMRVADKSWLFACGLALHRVAPTIGKKIMARSVNDHRLSMPVRSLVHVLQTCGFRVVHASPRGAVYSKDTGWAVKLSFALASLFWMATGKFMAPGALLVARKPEVL